VTSKTRINLHSQGNLRGKLTDAKNASCTTYGKQEQLTLKDDLNLKGKEIAMLKETVMEQNVELKLLRSERERFT
jgi:hypothetical protein